MTRDTTVSELNRLQADGDTAQAEAVFQMDEEAFRGFYDRTARPLWAYLARSCGDAHAADDLLQETYYRFLRSRAHLDGDAPRRYYLFRIATNLVHDRRRRRGPLERRAGTEKTLLDQAVDGGAVARAERTTDVSLAMARLKPRERALLWLAYANGSSHREIAEVLGLRTGSVKPLLFRARRRLAALLTRRSPATEEPGDAR